MIRRLAGAGAALAVTVCLGAPAQSAVAAPQPMSHCTTGSGVVLAVDFSHWGGPVLRSCGTTPTTGYTLLNQGGWHTTGTKHDGPAFICRIGYSGYQGGKQYPTSADEDCVLTPPASAYWSYWHAGPGATSWTYSQLGAMSYHPKPGSVDLWIFGGTDIGGTKGRPTVTPDQLRAHNTSPTGGGHGAGGGQHPGGTGGANGSGDGGPGAKGHAGTGGSHTDPAPHREDGKDTEAKPSKSARPSASASSAAASPGSGTGTGEAARSTPGDGTRVVDAAPAAEAPHDSGSFLPALVTAALLLVVGAAAFVVRRRRRTR